MMSMPRLCPVLITTLLASSSSAQTLVDWDFTGLVNPGVPSGATVNPLISSADAHASAGVSASDLVAVEGQPSNTGLLWASSTTNGELNHKYWDGDLSDISGTAHDGVADNWIAFTLFNTPGAALNVGRLSVSAWRNGTGAPGRYAFEVVVDGGTPQPFGTFQDDPDSGDSVYDWFHFDDDVSFLSTLEIRFQPVAGPGGQGTGNLHINGLRVEEGSETPTDPAGPNVLLIIADDLSASALGCYGNPQVQTPNIDALADQGVVFDRAYCQYPVCAASRASMGTGLYPSKIQALGGGFEYFDAAIGAHSTLPEHFRMNGYTTARVSKIYHMRIPGDITSGSSGPDHAASWDMTFNAQAPEWMTPGVAAHYTNENLNFNPGLHYNLGFGAAFYTVEGSLDGSEQADAVSAAEAVSLLGDLADEQFFLAVGFVRPHVPLVAPETVYDLYDAQQMQLAASVPGDLLDIPAAGVFWNEPVRGPWTDDARRHVLRAYYASVTFMDEQVGLVLDRLQELGLEDETIVVFTSDHGYHLGEHTMWQKLSLHEESARVPLIVRVPGLDSGRTDSLAELVDLYPTLAELTGLAVPAPCQGISLRPVLEDPDTSVRSAVLSSVSNGHLLRTEEWAYMRYNGGFEELYDMAPAPQGDPLQFTNLAGNPVYAGVLLQLRSMLDEKLLAVTSDPGQAYCFGDGSGATCPCSSWGESGAGCMTSSGTGATLTGGGLASLTSDGFTLSISGGPANQPGLLFQGLGTNSNPMGSGILCVAPMMRHGVQSLDDDGATSYSGLATHALSGMTLYYQYWFRDPGGPCSGNFNLTNGWQTVWY